MPPRKLSNQMVFTMIRSLDWRQFGNRERSFGYPCSGFSFLLARSAMTRLHLAAIGSARMLGFRSTENSGKPYHGSRFGAGAAFQASWLVTFSLCGLWHGIAVATAGI